MDRAAAADRNLPTAAVIFEFALVELHRQVWRLEIERDHLTTGVPEYLKSKNLDNLFWR